MPDLLRTELDLVICGTAAGSKSAQARAYYAHPSNKFWQILFQTGLTPVQFCPHEFRRLLEFGIGVTDLAKFSSGPDSNLSSASFDADAFRQKIERIQPRFVAFNGKKAAKVFFACKHIEYGMQKPRIGTTQTWVVPSTSPLAVRYWHPKHWQDLASRIQSTLK